MEDIKALVKKKSFDFVDTIRCISMIGIVFEHSSAVATGIYNEPFDKFIEVGLIQSFKFSTIAFFLIGGFLINHKFQEYSAIQYLKNRVKNTIRPWLFWMMIFMLFTIVDRYVAYFRGSDVGLLITNFPKYFLQLLNHTLFFTAYWFILNFLICIAILLLFKKLLYKVWFGAILACISLIYSVNLYYGWFITLHSAALFGFIFYLWLGVYLNKYYDKVIGFLNKTPWYLLLLLGIMSFLLSMAESFKLVSLGSGDAYNTLRISNICYSFIVFAILLKLGNVPFLQNKLQPRKTTFGIYLLHYLLISRFLPLIFQPLKLNYEHFSVWGNSGILFVRFLITYSLSFLITFLILKTRLKWTVGQ